MTTVKQNESVITSADRMSFSMFLAAIFHTIVLLGLSFVIPDKTMKEFQHTLDVVLATNFTEERPDEADFIGQANQEGGGEEEKAERPSTTEITPFPDKHMKEVTQPEQQMALSPVIEQNQVLLSEISDQSQIQPDTQPLEEQEAVDALSAESIYSRSLEIASLTAQLEANKNDRSKRPRKRQVSAAIHRSSDASYLDAWRRKIEKIGNLNYPEKARQEKIFGSLSLKVSINTDGTVHEISILRSSGFKILDDSAIRIVRLAAPFAPLTKEMAIDTEIFEIVRVWQFQPDNSMKTR